MKDALTERALEVLAEVMNDESTNTDDRLMAAQILIYKDREIQEEIRRRHEEIVSELRESRALLSEIQATLSVTMEAQR